MLSGNSRDEVCGTMKRDTSGSSQVHEKRVATKTMYALDKASSVLPKLFPVFEVRCRDYRIAGDTTLRGKCGDRYQG
jgi:hypothetical protein